MDAGAFGGASARKRRFGERLMDSGVVTFKIGAEKREFIIHKNFLLQKIPHFRRSCNPSGGFSESVTGVIQLSDVSVEVFGALSDWIYGGFLPGITEPASSPISSSGPVSSKPVITISESHSDVTEIVCNNQEESSSNFVTVKMYFKIMCLAQMWDCKELKSAAFGRILSYYLTTGQRLTHDLAAEGMTNMPDNSPFRNWILRVIAAQLLFTAPPSFSQEIKAFRSASSNVLQFDEEIMQAMAAWVTLRTQPIKPARLSEIFGKENIYSNGDEEKSEVLPAHNVLAQVRGERSVRYTCIGPARPGPSSGGGPL